MSHYLPSLDDGSKLSNGDLTAAANLYKLVKLNSSTKVILASAGTDVIYGSLYNDPNTNDPCRVAVLGPMVKVQAGTTISENDPITSDSAGKAAVAVPGDYVVGRANVDAVDGDIFEIRMTHEGTLAAANPTAKPVKVSFHFNLADIANGNIVSSYLPGFAGTVERMSATVTNPATTAAKLTTLNPEIAGTDVTGGVLALTSANMTPIGATVESTATTAAKTFTAVQTIDIEASSTTAFVEGEIDLILHLNAL